MRTLAMSGYFRVSRIARYFARSSTLTARLSILHAPEKAVAPFPLEQQPPPASPVLSWVVASPADRDLLLPRL
jgi:hypothetical protein